MKAKNRQKQTRNKMSADNEILVWKITPGDNGLTVDRYDLGKPVNSLDKASSILPGGAYTTLRTYARTKVMCLDDHLRRIEESAQSVSEGIHPQVTALRAALHQILHLSPYPQSRIRVTLDLEIDPGCFFVCLEKLHIPPDTAYREGVRVISRSMQRDNPKAKLTKFLTTAAKYRSQLPQGVNEMLMVDQNGVFLEGLSSNFFGVVKRSIWTVEEGVLLGITRSAVLEIARDNQIPVTFTGVHLSQLRSLEECFITSASRGVLPVVQIDDTIIGSGRPGPISQKLILGFNQWVEENIEEI
jgi:branched-chain amino acid aminotransferase